MIRVLCIDDSALVRQVLQAKLSQYPDIEVVGTAPDPYVARDKIVLLNPDVLTLDVEMPRMDGVAFLHKLMPQFPVPTVIFSSLAQDGGEIALNALAAGAFDFITKPSGGLSRKLPEMIAELVSKIRLAAKQDRMWLKSEYGSPHKAKKVITPVTKVLKGSTDKLIAIGASTGGTEALRAIIEVLPPNMPGMVVVQHMPPVMTKKFAQRLNELSQLEVKEAEEGDRVIIGRVLIAPGGKQMKILRSGGVYRVAILPGDLVNGHAPSVEVLFNSVAEYVGNNAIGIMLTGMGRDGAEAMLNMRKAGAMNLVQDEKSSVVWGMPGEAWKVGAAHKQLPLDKISEQMKNWSNEITKV